MLRAPFVDLLSTMTRPDLPMTTHEYGEWGDVAADPAALAAVRQILRRSACNRRSRLLAWSTLLKDGHGWTHQ